MPRPYRDLRRGEIAKAIRARDEECRQLKAFADQRYAEASAASGDDAQSMQRQLSLAHQSSVAFARHNALQEEVLAMTFELHIRDTPHLLAEFGPGAD